MIILPPEPFSHQHTPFLPKPKPLPLNMPQKLQPIISNALPLPSWLLQLCLLKLYALNVGSPCLLPAAVILLPARFSHKCQNHGFALMGTTEELAQLPLPTGVPRWAAGRRKGHIRGKTGSVLAPFKSFVCWFGAAFWSCESCKYLSFLPFPSQWLQIKALCVWSISIATSHQLEFAKKLYFICDITVKSVKCHSLKAFQNTCEKGKLGKIAFYASG